MRDVLLSDLLRWFPEERWGTDGFHCAERKNSYHRLRVYHDALTKFVRNGTIPPDMRKQANDEAVQVLMNATGRYVDLSDADASDADEAACCRIIARGGLVSGTRRQACPGEAPDTPIIPYPHFPPLPWHKTNP